jgi:iron complex outermembrane receptor protein
MLKKTRYFCAYFGALTVLGTFAAAPAIGAEPATSAQPTPSVAEEIVVTGSRLSRNELESVGPVTVLTESELKATGYTTVEDMIQDLPYVTGGDLGSTVNNGSDGLATVSLRGLGPTRTLVLVDGHRPGNSGTNGFVDLNSVPSAMVERIEVLRDGATAVYGSDAIAGVINIITKKDYEGATFDAQYDITDENDGDNYAYSAVFGGAYDRGHFTLGVQYTKRDPIWQKDRDFSECPIAEVDSAKVCSGSGSTVPPQIVYTTQTTPALATSYVIDQTTGELREYNGTSDAFNFAAVSYLQTPQKVWNGFGSATYDLIEESNLGTASAYLQATFSSRQSDQLLAPTATFWGIPVPVTNDFNPFGTVQCASNPLCVNGAQEVFISRRITESGGRNYTQDLDTWRILIGTEGDLPNGWHWDMSYNYAEGNETQRDAGQIIQPRANALADPALCAADPECPGLWDMFNAGTLTPEQANYMLVAPNTNNRSTLKVGQINLTGDVGYFELPGGPIEWSVGYEKRSEEAASLPDAGASIGAIYFFAGDETKGAYNVSEFYGESRFPILEGVRFAESLALEVAARYSDYNNQDDSRTTWRYALEWAPITDLRLRGVYSEGFRAPNIDDLYAASQLTAASYGEPCQNWGTNANPVIQANCAADGLPQNFFLGTEQALGYEGGNIDLEPETSKSWTYGIVYTPSFVEGLAVTLDWFDIEIDDAIGTAGAGNIIQNCYASPNFSDSLCALLRGPAFTGEAVSATAPTRRNNQQQVSGLELRNVNISTFETKGIDFSATYGFETAIGHFDLRAIGTWLDTYDYLPFDGGDTLEYQGKFANDPYFTENIAAYPEWQYDFMIGYTRDVWGVTLITRFLQSVEDLNADPSNLENETGDVYYFDMQGFYEWNKFTFTAGIRNLADEDPPYVTSNDDMNTLQSSYDTAGRYYYTRFAVQL